MLSGSCCPGPKMVLVMRISGTNWASVERADPLGSTPMMAAVCRLFKNSSSTPSIAESRENFRITAVKVYEIKNGQLGQLYRDGGITSDSRDYFMSIDAVGNDLRVNPIPNCGKGQPMQAKRMSNGGPTMRGIARLTGPG